MREVNNERSDLGLQMRVDSFDNDVVSDGLLELFMSEFDTLSWVAGEGGVDAVGVDDDQLAYLLFARSRLSAFWIPLQRVKVVCVGIVASLGDQFAAAVSGGLFGQILKAFCL